jgi:hypothetical protein
MPDHRKEDYDMRELVKSGVKVEDVATGERLHLSLFRSGKAEERNIEENGDVVVVQPDGTLKCFASGRVYRRVG